MRTMFENLNAIVANTLTDSIKMIDIDELHDSEDNFFDVNRVEEFAETILGQGGIKDNLIVRPLESGGYEIISGHRRKAAIQYLLDNGENVSRYLPCLLQNYGDNDDKLLDMVLMNVSSRQISDAEMWKSYEIVDRILKSKKSAGEKFGRIREKLAECLGVSPAQVGKMQNVDKNAIEPVKNAVSNGEISISTANEIARLSEDEQEEIMQSDLDTISHKDIKKKNDDKKVATYGNFSEDSLEVSDKDDVEIYDDDFSEDDNSEPDSATEKVATYGNFSEDSLEVSDENDVEIDDDNFSENDDSEPDSTTKKVATNSNFSEDSPEVFDEDDEETDDDDFSEDDNSEPDSTTKKVATNSNFSEDSLEVSSEDDVEIDDDNFSEDDDSEPDSATEKVATNGNFSGDSSEVSGEDDVEIYDDDFSEDDDSEPESETESDANFENFICENYIRLKKMLTRAMFDINVGPMESYLFTELMKFMEIIYNKNKK